MADLFELTRPTAEVGEELPELPELNDQQRAAVRHGQGPLLVVAGAGTGKTRVITERVRHLLNADPGLPGESILALTFTDRAAGEMKHRIARAAGERGRAVFVGTFHAFCNALLIERNPKLQALDDIDHWILLRRNLAVLALDRYRRLAEPGQFLGDFVKFFSRCQDELVTPEDYERYTESLAEAYAREKNGLAEEERAIREEALAEQREVARAYRASDSLLRERNLLTFGMQLSEAVRLLKSDAAFRDALRARYRYILVDEFQDTNIAQIELLWELAADHRNVVAVGDSAQAIYRFRGASFGSFTIFLERFAGVPRGDSAGAARFVQPLVDNYRSTARILRTATQIASFIDHSPLVPKKELLPHKPDGEKVRIVEFPSAQEEARWIAAEIERLHAAGLSWRRFAALYRIHSHRNELVRALEERGIPFVIRNLSILDHPLVRDLTAYLRLIVKPADNVACARVLAAPAWGLDAADLVRLCERSKKAKSSLWDALQPRQGQLPFSGPPAATQNLVAGLNGLRARMETMDAADLFAALTEWLELPLHLRGSDQPYLRRFAQFVREWQSKSETCRLPRIRGVSRLFRAGRRANQPGTGLRRRRSTHDRACRQRTGVRSRFRVAADAPRFSHGAASDRAGISPGAHERGVAAGRLSYSGRAAPVLRGHHAGARAAHPDYGAAQALAAFGFHRRHFERGQGGQTKRGTDLAGFASLRDPAPRPCPASPFSSRKPPSSRAFIRALAPGPSDTVRLFSNRCS